MKFIPHSNKLSNSIAVLFFVLCSTFAFSAEKMTFPDHDSAPAPACCSSLHDRTQFDSLDIKTLGNEYQRLKQLNCSDCDNFSSDLAEIMRALEPKLQGKSKRQVKGIMGRPDEKSFGVLIYYWRGKHDYLIIEFGRNGAIVNWYYAYE